ncbi:transposase [Desulfohalobiaceae bacterium Ax17]|jgi:transposase-like protein|uniref:transposase n=1 Tax=Desulfovulcanus ferrireducens TaxID=2831190 RepID=UPI00207BCE57|nr:transposase [Desulfovulcanus ferrireducens]MBT8762520.1 transposase [Desulfovulcanus ferrireducens]
MRRFDADFKDKVALETIRGEKSVEEIARYYQVCPGRISNWRKKTLEEIPTLFSDGNRSQQRTMERNKFAALNREVQLYRYRLTLYR